MTESTARSGRDLIRRLRAVDATALLEFFTERQYVKPRTTLLELLEEADQRLGVCPVVAKRAVAWLEMDGQGSIGRLRRTELTQLARCLHRFLRHTGACSGGHASRNGTSARVKRPCRL